MTMVLCDREGRVYDVWITFGSVHEVRAFRERKRRRVRGKVWWAKRRRKIVRRDNGKVVLADNNAKLGLLLMEIRKAQDKLKGMI